MISTNYGLITGVDRGSYTEYRSVPYAKPPIGPLRWKAPQPPEPWEGILEATVFKSRCMEAPMVQQPPYSTDFYDNPEYDRPMSEDCLYLHIWAPNIGKGLPVAFWIHGGAFLGGYATEKEFDGRAYCDRGVILVSVDYRCNIFGFFAHPWLSQEQGGHSGNYGILDQIAALSWVRENIAAFGGDPDNITIFGQSAGAMSVQTLVSTPLTKGMISKAILQSGGSYGTGLHRDISQQEQYGYGQAFVDLVGAPSLEALRSMDAQQLVDGLAKFIPKMFASGKGLVLCPTMDGAVLHDGYYALMDQGQLHDIPYLLGSTQDDILVTPEMRKSGTFSPLYHGINAFSLKLEALGRKPAYVYYFTRELPGDDFGAWHSCELEYSFGTLDRVSRPWQQRDYALSERILDYWTNFMKTGNPNGEGLPAWQPHSRANPAILELN